MIPLSRGWRFQVRARDAVSTQVRSVSGHKRAPRYYARNSRLVDPSRRVD